MGQKLSYEELEQKILALQQEVNTLKQGKSPQEASPQKKPPQKKKEKINIPVKPSTVLKKHNQKSPPGTPLNGRALKLKLLGTLKDLPAMSQVLTQAQRVMADHRSSLKDLANIMKTDPAIVTKALRIANSAYYGMRGEVSSIEHCSVMLGHKGFGELVTMSAASRFLSKKLKGYGVEAGVLWQHSLAVAFGARIIANRTTPALANDAFIAGIIHDVGKIILDKPIFERKSEFEALMADWALTFLEAEKEILGFNHVEIAYAMCKRWHFPPGITLPIKYHHSPSLSGGNKLAYIIHVANAIALMSDVEADDDMDMWDLLDDSAAEFLGLHHEDVSDIMTKVVKSVEEVKLKYT
ncbi:MAG: HDOD domain-containing protein [Deltaproteobacteria bacterium]|nr:HDOD domain-containing protein [Deltaproteobacteria bacterium]